jgi:hypothetical protein
MGLFLGFISDNPVKVNFSRTNDGSEKLVYGPHLDNPLQALNESFEGATFPPAGWVATSPLGNEGWTRQTVGTTPFPGFTGGTVTAPTGGGSAVANVIYGQVATNDREWLITPQITNCQPGDSLTFWLRYFSSQYADSVSVKVSTTTQTPAGMTSTVMAKRFFGTADTGWVQYKFVMSSATPAITPGANIYIGFLKSIVDNATNGSGFSMDLVSYKPAAAPAPDPTTWYEIPSTTTGITTQINGVSAPDINTVWACGASGKVIRSTNGGGNWTSAAGNLLASDIFYCIWAIDANTCLVSSSPSASNVYRTTNAGVNWTQVFTQPGGFIDGWYFKDANNGIMMGDATGGRWSLWKTSNGGANWDSTGMNVPSTEASWTMSIYGIGNTVWFGGNTSKMYKSTNFGTNWTSLTTGTEVNGYSVWFNDLNNGMNGGATLQQTTNGGTTFTANAVPGTGNIQGLCGVGSKWWVGRANIVYQSTNNGTAWTTAFTASGTSQIWNMTIARTGSPYIYAGRVNGTILKYGGLVLGTPVNNAVVTDYSLNQNYPNPFNPTTSISFAIPQNGFVSLKVYNMLGKEVATLVNGNLNSGQHNYNFNASNLASGVYFYKLEAGNFSEVKKMSLIK